MAHTLSCSLTGKSTFFCKPTAPLNAVPVCFFTTSAPCSHHSTFHVSNGALFCTVKVPCFCTVAVPNTGQSADKLSADPPFWEPTNMQYALAGCQKP